MTSLSAGPRIRTSFECSSCGAPHPSWGGRCGTCGDWNALVEVPVARSGLALGSHPVLEVGEARPMSALSPDASGAVPTGIAEVDRAFGGGLVPGSVTLLGGAPGVGKSSLPLQLAAARVRAGGRVLLGSAEESAAQVRLRAERLGAVHDGLWLADDTSIEAIVSHLDELRPDLLIVDSVQTVHLVAESGGPGSMSQVRA